MPAEILLIFLILAGPQSRPFDYAGACVDEVQGMKILVSSTIKVHRPALVPKLDALDFRKFCPCYHGRLKKELGDGLYERTRRLYQDPPLSTDELMRVDATERRTILGCAEAQLSGRDIPSNEPRYQRFIRSAITPGNGIGGLKPGSTRDDLFRILGPSKTFRRAADGTETYYYGPNSIEVIVSLSPAGRVRRITLDRHFQGRTRGGGGIGASRAAIQRSHPGKVVSSSRELLVYCDGTTFRFSDDRLTSIQIAALEDDPFVRERRRLCSDR